MSCAINDKSNDGEERRAIRIIGTVSFECAHISKVKEEACYSYYGTVAGLLKKDDAAEFLTKMCDGDPAELNIILGSFLHASHNNCHGSVAQKAAMWFDIRIDVLNENFRKPRWHQDGRFFRRDADRTGAIYKYATTILGPATLFLQWNEELAHYTATDEFSKGMNEGNMERLKVAERLSGQEVLKLERGQIVKFSSNQKDSPVHSEPDFTSDRIFLSVLFASASEIRSMCQIRNTIYQE